MGINIFELLPYMATKDKNSVIYYSKIQRGKIFMKRKLISCLILCMCCLVGCRGGNFRSAQNGLMERESEVITYDEEILFRDVPWGTNYTKVDEILGELNLWALSGEAYRTFSTDEIILGDYQGIDFEYGDINIIANASNDEIDVAGYKAKDIVLYFSYMPVDGVLTKEDEDSALYGAQYKFDTQNLDEMSSDLVSKLTLLYGEPSKTTQKTDIYLNRYTYTYWFGEKDTVIVLKTQNTEDDTTGLYDDEIIISYVWLKGDELLQNASDILKQEAVDKEAEVYGNGESNGL